MAKVFREGQPNFPANQDELDKRLAEIEQLINKLAANIEFCEAAFQLMQDCDLITGDNIRFLCSAQACKEYAPNFWFIRNRKEGVLRPAEDYNNVFTGKYQRFYSGFEMRVEFYGQNFLIVNDWYKDFSEDCYWQIKPSPCPNKRAFYNWLKEKAQEACNKHWAGQKRYKNSETIDDETLKEHMSWEEIKIPNGVKSIGDCAFICCTNLKKIIIPAGVTSIGDGAFENCRSLKEVTIPNSVKSIGDSAFSCCESLKEVTIPDSVKFIGEGAFVWCTNLTCIKLSDSITSIGEALFGNCMNLKEITIPDSVKFIGDLVFNDCWNLTKITIPDGVKFIGDSAFNGCTNLEEIHISDSTLSQESVKHSINDFLKENSSCKIISRPKEHYEI